MQEQNSESPPINKNMLIVLAVLIVLVIVYMLMNLFSGTGLNIYERSATAIEENATRSAENNGDIQDLLDALEVSATGS